MLHTVLRLCARCGKREETNHPAAHSTKLMGRCGIEREQSILTWSIISANLSGWRQRPNQHVQREYLLPLLLGLQVLVMSPSGLFLWHGAVAV